MYSSCSCNELIRSARAISISEKLYKEVSGHRQVKVASRIGLLSGQR